MKLLRCQLILLLFIHFSYVWSEYLGTTLTRERIRKVCMCYKIGIKNDNILECVRRKRLVKGLVYRPLNVTCSCSDKFDKEETCSSQGVEQSFRKRICGRWNEKQTIPLIECIRRQTTRLSNLEDLSIARKAHDAMHECCVELGCCKRP